MDIFDSFPSLEVNFSILYNYLLAMGFFSLCFI